MICGCFFGFSRTIKAYSYPYKTFETKRDWPPWQFGLSGRGGLLHYRTNHALSDKCCLLIGNSFGIELAPHLATAFRDLYYFNLNVLEKKDEELFFSRITNSIKPDRIYILFDDAGIIAAPQRLAAFSRL